MAEGGEGFPINPEISIPEKTPVLPSPERSPESSFISNPQEDILQNVAIAQAQGREMDAVAWRKLHDSYPDLLAQHPGEFAVFGTLGVLRTEKDQKEANFAADSYGAGWGGSPLQTSDGMWSIFNTAGSRFDFPTQEEAQAGLNLHYVFEPDPNVHVYEIKEKIEKPASPFDDFFEENPMDPELANSFEDLFLDAIATGDFSPKPIKTD